MNPTAIQTTNGPQAPDAACDSEAYDSYSEFLEAKWEELVIQFDHEKGTHVIRTACCPMAPVC